MRFVLIPLLLGACALAPTPRPTEAALRADGLLSVRLSDAQLCTARLSDGTELVDGWEGVLEGCSVPYSYIVTADPVANPVRLVLGEFLPGTAFAQAAQIVVLDGQGGRWRFQSPPPLPD